ncbi:MAG: YaaR family protein [Synergistaceae bacterium]|nr:YaaR family protein [Synergistaceae bacterium]
MKVSGAKFKSGETAPHSGQAAARGTSVSGVHGAEKTFAEISEDIELQGMITELDEIGAALSRYPTSALLGRYRELVKMALNRVKNGMRIKREFKWRRTERSMFMVIERAEDALAELEALESALGRERDRTRIFSLIDEIKGCLISLLF